MSLFVVLKWLLKSCVINVARLGRFSILYISKRYYEMPYSQFLNISDHALGKCLPIFTLWGLSGFGDPERF